MRLELVIGGTRSGKSAHAERLARASGLDVRYVATADGGDPAMAERIDAHAARRPGGWTTLEAGTRLLDVLAGAAGGCVLIDGLGVWIAGALHRGASPAEVLEQLRALLDALDGEQAPALAIVVAEQAGAGVLPADAVSRAWLDLLGEATQLLAARASHVAIVVAGRPLTLSGGSPRAANGSAPSAALREHGDRQVRPGDADHAVNVLAGGPPEWLRAELRQALEGDVERYPDETAACAALAALHGREAREIVPTNGGAEALWLIPAALRPALAACVHPGFTEAEAALRAHGIPVTRVLRERGRDFALDPREVPAEADLVLLGNPASPSGTLDPAATLLALRRPGRVVVVDEAFMDLVPGEPGTLVRERLEDVIVVRSLTKALAIPGLRAGYAVAPPALAERLREARPPWSANALALAALAAAARRPDALATLAERARREREDLEWRLAAVPGVRTWPSAANFCLVEVADGPGVLAALREQRIAVRAAASFPGLGEGDLRLTARSPSENERLAAALAAAIDARATAGAASLR
ncbi:MAG TPA: bifunctional adenosylcobinamide kinase/adenosylcobinamide-phosphate guanylyltransferase [Solirubrobacteraceae bacterium]|jgi:histidinol-phosphate/aromatic aminotransferase/cobyric acid decarboxylase-like protein/adenosyl cobinamide kinase/adenosyl cobinamide phosphate guanylyltransferase|nr:bifunctional adenosylcobinamide kinase/adenosylcobinamide-phosphate guanylyltransferase [Solirubrobacteraceae bacterium]